MGIAVDTAQQELQGTARRVLDGLCPPSVPRGLLDAETTPELPSCWAGLAELGWLGLAVAEEHGGAGLGLVDLVTVVEELGRHVVPGPVLPSILAGLIVQRWGSDTLAKEVLPGLIDGSTPAAVALGPAPRISHADADGLVVTGELGAVECAHQAVLVLIPVAGGRMALVPAHDLSIEPVESLDRTRRLARVSAHDVRIPAERIIDVTEDRLCDRAPTAVRDLAALLAGAEACGSAGWCLDTVAAYAKVRVQFGRPIGQFQAVKHKCSDLLVALEQARAAVWDAARAFPEELPMAVSASLAVPTAVRAAKDAVQLLGGIGYTWEHDVHVYLKRAVAQQAIHGTTSVHRARVAALARAGHRRTLALQLPPEAEQIRDEVRRELAAYRELSDDAAKVDWMASWLAPHWPAPYGRDAAALEQLVIDEEFKAARVRRPHLAVGAWALPTIIAHGTVEQQQRYVEPGLRGQLTWCQMFSEPGAGSDLAALQTKAVRTDGGWLVTGQKVWTSLAQWATHAILLARTGSPSQDRRQGITYFVLDMKTPGIDLRPLRELTGHAMFNEVFLDEVFIADDCVIGEVGDGWRLARTTLANERVNMGSGSSFGAGVESLLGLAPDEPVLNDTLGALVAEAQTMALMGLRMTLKQISGAEPGSESSVRKLLGAEHDQRVQELGMTLLDAAVQEGDAKRWTDAFLATRCMTIAGGTSEVQRNVVAERLLGLPRDAG
jgi:alkylation response protein AidB-like acyl-CoA dehydrogenase